MMLAYYRNPLNQIFFNEGIVIVSMQSFGLDQAWTGGIDINELFNRACFLSKLLEKEEV
jgi:Glycerol-3-phosphate acyltransferase C-terminal region